MKKFSKKSESVSEMKKNFLQRKCFQNKNIFALQLIYKWKRFHFRKVFRMETFSFTNHLQIESVFEMKVKFYSKRKRFHL